MIKSFQMWDHFFPFFPPKDSEYLKCLDIGLREVGEQRRLNHGCKVWRTQTNRHTDLSTHRKNQPRGPIQTIFHQKLPVYPLPSRTISGIRNTFRGSNLYIILWPICPPDTDIDTIPNFVTCPTVQVHIKYMGIAPSTLKYKDTFWSNVKKPHSWSCACTVYMVCEFSGI